MVPPYRCYKKQGFTRNGKPLFCFRKVTTNLLQNLQKTPVFEAVTTKSYYKVKTSKYLSVRRIAYRSLQKI